MRSHPLSIIQVGIALCALAGCQRESNRWQPAPAVADEAAPVTEPISHDDQRIVLFAPTALGPLTAIYANARLDFPHDMALRMDLLLRDHDGRVGENLPDSDNRAWEARVAAVAGTHLVVLSTVDDLKRIPGRAGVAGMPPQVRVVVRMRALDVNGNEVWAKRASGAAEASLSPKLLDASARPESRAAWDAFSVGLKSLFAWLESRPDLVSTANRGADEPPGNALIEVAIDSQPPNADILIDGELRGTTPRRLKLPPRAMTIRLERQGHQPWSRTVIPRAGLELAPALEPLP